MVGCFLDLIFSCCFKKSAGIQGFKGFIVIFFPVQSDASFAVHSECLKVKGQIKDGARRFVSTADSLSFTRHSLHQVTESETFV